MIRLSHLGNTLSPGHSVSANSSPQTWTGLSVVSQHDSKEVLKCPLNGPGKSGPYSVGAKLKMFAHIAFALTFMLRSFCFKFEDLEQLAGRY